MAWEVTLPDGSTGRTDHLEVGAVVDIAKECNTTWAHVVDFTVGGTGEVMLAVYEHMLADRGLTKPEGLTMAKLGTLFAKVEDDLPTEFEDGVPQPGDAPATD